VSTSRGRRSRRRWPTALAFGCILLVLAVVGAGSAATQAPPSPVVTLERTDLVGGAPVPVTLWFTGGETATIADVWLIFVGPDFLALREPSGAATAKPLGPYIGAGPIRLELATVGPLREGRFTLAFGIRYAFGGSSNTHAVVVEKTVEIGRLGVGSIGGVPLQFAAYLLPGLIAVMVVRMCRVGWAQHLQALELGAISFLLSMLLLVSVERLTAAGWGFASLDIVTLGIGGALLGLGLALPRLLGQAAGFVTRRRQERAAANLVAVDDDFVTAVAKAFRQKRHAETGKAVRVETTSGAIFAGSVAADTADGGLLLLGWQKLTAEPDQGWCELVERCDWPTLADRIDQRHRNAPLDLQDYNLVRRWGGDNWEPAGARELFAAAAVKSVESIDFAELGLTGSGFPIALE